MSIDTLGNLAQAVNDLLKSNPELADLPLFTTDCFNDPLAQGGSFDIAESVVHRSEEEQQYYADPEGVEGELEEIRCVLFAQIS